MIISRDVFPIPDTNVSVARNINIQPPVLFGLQAIILLQGHLVPVIPAHPKLRIETTSIQLRT